MATATPADTADFESVEAPDLVGLVEAQLTRAIVEGRLAPGARVFEADIARRMGVSRAPVREAARRLERQGVLVARPRHGFAVRTITVREIDDLFEVRTSLEMTSIELACRRADDAGLTRLQALVHQMVSEATTHPQHHRIATDLAFHTLICELSGNAHLHRIFSNIQTEMRMIIALFDAFSRDPVAMAQTHQPIVDALVSRDPAACRAAMHLHLDDAWKHVRALFVEQHGAAPTPPQSKRPRLAKEPTP